MMRFVLPLLRRPLIPSAFLLAIGIASADLVPTGSYAAVTSVAVAVLIIAFVFFRSRMAIPLFLSIWLIGVCLGRFAWDTGSHVPPDFDICEGVVANRVQVGAERSSVVVDVTHCRDTSGGEVMTPVKARASLGSDVLPDGLVRGALVRFRARLHKPHPRNNPGGDTNFTRLVAEGISAVGRLSDERWISVVSPARGFSITRQMDRWAGLVENRIGEFSDGDIKGVLFATITGNGRALTQDAWDRFRRVGVIHLLVISGFQVACVGLCLWWAIGWILRRSSRMIVRVPVWKIGALLCAVGVWLYALFVGSGSPVVRAAVMISSLALAAIVGRLRDIWSAIALAACAILVWSPLDLFLPSFQLTFASLIGIVAWGPWLRRLYLSRLDGRSFRKASARWFLDGISVTVAASIGVLPIVAWHFHSVSQMGLVTNILLVPLVGFLLTPLGLLFATVAPISDAMASLLSGPLVWLARFIVWFVGVADSSSGPWQIGFTPTPVEIILWYAALAVPLVWKGRGVRVLVSSIALICAIWIGGVRLVDAFASPSLSITFLDVGQGNSAVIQFPNGKVMVVDGGGAPESRFDIGRNVVAKALHHMHVRNVDYLVMTHPHPDHYGGLAYLAEEFSPAVLWVNGDAPEQEDGNWADFEARINRVGLRKEIVDSQTAALQEGGAEVRIIHPAHGRARAPDRNNNSVVLLVTHGEKRILLTADIEREVEERLVEGRLAGKVDVLQVPHHGSSTSSTRAFLEVTRPSIAVISCGRGNRYNFPRQDVLERLKQVDAAIYRTDQDGALTIRTNGKSVYASGRAGGQSFP